MQHVLGSWLRRIHWMLLGYAVLIWTAYILVAFFGQEFLAVSYATPPWSLLGVLAFLQAAAELGSSRFLSKDNPQLTAYVSLGGNFAVTLALMLATNTFHSPFVMGMLALVILAPAVRAYVGLSMLPVLVVVAGLDFAGLLHLQLPFNWSRTLMVIAMATLCAVVAQLLWRRYYQQKDAAVVELSSSLSKEQAKSDIILNTIEDGVILVDTSKAIRLFNPGASKITGWPVEEAIGLDHLVVLHLVDEKNAEYSKEYNPFNRVFEDKKTIRDSRAILVSRSDKRISLDINASPLFDQEGNVTGAVGVFRDVSEERGEEKRRAEFISTASHEMRTPVAAIEGYLALAMNDRVSKIDSKAHGFLEKAHASTTHLGKLFQDLLTSAKAEDGRLSNHPSIVEMGEYLEKLSEDLRFTAEKKGLHMEFVVGAADQIIDASNNAGTKVVRPLYYVNVDPERMREVITNLFDNAVKYTEAGSVSLGLTGNGEVVQIYVQDTGPGIPTEDIPHLFQKFYRVDSSATRTIGGTGLGLFICRKIVELYNGRVWVESDVGKGSTFFINLPRIANQKATQMQVVEASQHSVIAT
jgi:PAS domain S-box-containing protein